MRAIALLCLLLAGCNVRIGVSLFGDSNTASSFPGPAPIQKWVQMLAALKPEWTFYEHGVPNQRLVDLASPAGLVALDAAINADSSFIVGIANGEADAIQIVFGNESLQDAYAAIDTLVAHVHATFPLRYFGMALIPPGFGFAGGITPTVDQLNAYIQTKLPANRIADFNTIALAEDTYDGLHFCGNPWIPPCTSAHGEEVRANVAFTLLSQ